MNMLLVLQAAKAANSVIGAMTKPKAVKVAYREQKKTAEKYYEFNKEQLNRAYDKSIANVMTKYVTDRMNITDEYNQMNTQLNMQASQAGINLADSSFQNDAQNQLDLEFTTNLQNNYTNLINQANELAYNKSNLNLQLGINYNNQIKQIETAYNTVRDTSYDKALSDVMDFGSVMLDDYRSWKAKKNIAKEESGVKDYLNFTF